MTEEKMSFFREFIRDRSGQESALCYQCLKCTSGCPVAGHMDYPPHAVHRLVVVGGRRELLRSRSIWLCTACETCGQRCPNEINTARVMDALKRLATAESSGGGEKGMRAMHRAFLAGIAKRGRMHELSLIRDMRLRSGGLFKDLGLGVKMFRKGKLSLFPKKIRDTAPLRALFRKKGAS